MSLPLNNEEKNILKTLSELQQGEKGVNYYDLVDALHVEGDTSAIIPVVSRLEDDGYITSNGLIYRYLYLTDKGRKEN